MSQLISTDPVIADMELYYTIAESNIEQFNKIAVQSSFLESKLQKILQKCSDPTTPPFEFYEIHIDLDPLIEESRKCCITATVFTVFYFESLIYDYATKNLADHFFNETYLHLDFLSRWSVLPKLITGYELTHADLGYRALKEIYEDRNYFTYIKEDEIKLGKDLIPKNFKQRGIVSAATVRNCQIALTELPQDLKRLDAKSNTKRPSTTT